MQENIATLYNYIDNTDNDIIMHCLSHCLFEKAAILLSFYPNYFNEHFVGGVKHERKFNNERLADIIKSYSQDEYAAFLVFLEHLNIALDEDLMPRPLNATPAFYT